MVQTSLRYVRLALSLWCTAMLSGCLTSRLWREEEAATLVRHEQQAELTIDGVAGDDGSLEVVAERRSAGDLPPASGAAARQSGWRLLPREQADEAAVLLGGGSPFVVTDRRLEVYRDANAGEVYRSTAALQLAVTVGQDALAVPVDGAQLPVAVGAALQNAPRNDFSGPGPGRLLPGMLAECADRLCEVDLGLLLPSTVLAAAAPVQLRAYAWLAASSSQPVTDAAGAVAVLGPDFATGDLPLPERLQRLQRLRLLVAVDVGSARQTFLLRPDVVWLRGVMAPSGDGALRHESRWLAEAHGEVPAVSVVEAAATQGQPVPMRWHGTMQLRWYDYHYEVQRSLALQLVLTPFAVVADAVGIGLLAVLFGWCDDEDEDEDAAWSDRRTACRR